MSVEREYPAIDTSVLYLRSFQDEALTSQAPVENAFWPFRVKTGEETLVEALQGAGPVIAIGRPGERLPELGARRFYFTDDGWRAVARAWISESRLVVLRVGETGGLWWEVQTAVGQAKPGRLLLVVPDHRASYNAFRDRFNAEFAPRCELPALKLSDHASWSLAGFVQFDGDWTPAYVRFRASSTGSIKKSLRTVFQRVAEL